ncbi:hypothetical protein [Burkholderia vietnamiensis]|uniref:hypothetical protein n=1 Tax=Burkholderia vietnamiensis TaxID=60552 RepID=UPI001B93C91E|nr:hypothetical protein [Burkholderia vietnamiensis]MBR8279749.1 hypothetical protein [Burkholderia vietnamiensis]
MDEREMTPCAECGMPCRTGEYHPYAACLMFKACNNSDTVRGNLQDVLDAGRRTTPDRDAWQPIETAPKFGDPIDIWGRYGRTPNCVWGKPTYVGGVRWVHEAGYDSNGPVFEIVVDPTHWMPLPAAPTSDKGD